MGSHIPPPLGKHHSPIYLFNVFFLEICFFFFSILIFSFSNPESLCLLLGGRGPVLRLPGPEDELHLGPQEPAVFPLRPGAQVPPHCSGGGLAAAVDVGLEAAGLRELLGQLIALGKELGLDEE